MTRKIRRNPFTDQVAAKDAGDDEACSTMKITLPHFGTWLTADSRSGDWHRPYGNAVHQQPYHPRRYSVPDASGKINVTLCSQPRQMSGFLIVLRESRQQYFLASLLAACITIHGLNARCSINTVIHLLRNHTIDNPSLHHRYDLVTHWWCVRQIPDTLHFPQCCIRIGGAVAKVQDRPVLRLLFPTPARICSRQRRIRRVFVAFRPVY